MLVLGVPDEGYSRNASFALNLISTFLLRPTVRHTFWNIIVGGGFFWTAVYGINQAQVQRALSLPSLKKARM
jgi:hypothetical protein